MRGNRSTPITSSVTEWFLLIRSTGSTDGESQLFGIIPFDITILFGTDAKLSFAAVTAGLLPASRATRVNPVDSFRQE
jgi:hypothetical protein